jgi:hypothetical protein
MLEMMGYRCADDPSYRMCVWKNLLDRIWSG